MADLRINRNTFMQFHSDTLKESELVLYACTYHTKPISKYQVSMAEEHDPYSSSSEIMLGPKQQRPAESIRMALDVSAPEVGREPTSRSVGITATQLQ